MNASRIAKLFILTILVLLSLYPISSAMAVKPITSTEEFDVSEERIADCGDFFILADSHQTFVIREFYYKDGELEKTQVHWSSTGGEVYSSANPSRRLPEGPDHATWYYYPESDFLTQAGLALHVTVPGEGIIGINVGRIIMIPTGDYWEWDVLWDKGQNDVFNGELDVLCSYLRQ